VGLKASCNERPGLTVRDRLAGEHVGPANAVFQGGVFLFGALEAVEVGRYAYVLKAQVAQEREELCLRQSAGDSTGPQVDIAASFVAEFGVEHYICKLQPAAGPQHAADLGKRFLLFWDQVEHAVGDDNIDAGIR
jgi:hypothetical protein